MATIKQVAEKAGVSVATVSRVLNNHATVSAATQQKVQLAIDKLNYKPSLLGRNLRTSSSNLILLLIPEISNPYYFEIIKGLEETALQNQYNILLCETGLDDERENIYFDLVKSKMADGVISMDPAVNIEKLKKLSQDFPIIQCSEYDEVSGIPYVSINHEQAALDAVQYLIDIGHRNIALINSNKKFLYARQRERGYQEALIQNGIPLDDSLIYYAEELNFENGQQLMRDILQRGPLPTAVFAVSDLLAIGALKEIQAQALHVPEDIALLGFDNIDFSKMTFPELSTVEQPMYTLGATAAQMLIDQLNNRPVENMIVPHRVVKRHST